jgi:hypothetical protein
MPPPTLAERRLRNADPAKAETYYDCGALFQLFGNNKPDPGEVNKSCTDYWGRKVLAKTKAPHATKKNPRQSTHWVY